MISFIGTLEGITALCVLIFASLFGLFSIIQGFKKGVDLLKIAGFMIVFIGLLWLGPSTDFITIIITGRNLDNTYGLYGILSYMWVAPAVILAIAIGAELLVKERKQIIICLFIILAFIFEFLLFFYTKESFIFVEPEESGITLIDSQHNTKFYTFYLIIIFLGSVALFNGIGFLMKARKTTGEIKKKFNLLSEGFLLFVICAAFDSLATPGIGLIFVRLGVIGSIILLYNGLKT
ncbi:MAG: hypothetical protein ACTSQP_16060 [Promethearchaeota archaeon]